MDKDEARTLEVRGMAMPVKETVTGRKTDLDNHRLATTFKDSRGRTVHLQAGLTQPVDGRIDEQHPYGFTGMVLSAYYGDDEHDKVPHFVPTPINGAGLRRPADAALFPYTRKGLLALVNREFGTGFTALRLIQPEG